MVVPPAESTFVPEENSIVGNVSLYGATGGEVFLRGRAGERFAVRNSGATAVVEGVGDHGCEYMTRGLVVVLGPTGRNFAAGMSGGLAWVWDPVGTFAPLCNRGGIDIETGSEAELDQIRELVRRHQHYTQSALAARLLADWDAERQAFRKVVPTEYRRVLDTQHLSGEAAQVASV